MLLKEPTHTYQYTQMMFSYIKRMFCNKTDLGIAQETFYFNDIIATCGTGSWNFRAIAKSKFGTLPSDVKVCKMANNEWMI